MARTRFLNRLRFILDRRLSAANIIDRAAEAHRGILVRFDTPPPYDVLKRELSASDILRFACRFGVLLRERLGLDRWDRVAVMKSNHGDITLMGLAAMRAGLVAVPINCGMPADIAAGYLSYTGARCLVTDARVFGRLSAADAIPDSVEHILITDLASSGLRPGDDRARDLGEALEETPPDAWLPPAELFEDDHVLICHTSGTTGIPKGVIHTSGSLVAGVKGQLKIEPVFRFDTALSASPFNHFINHSGLMSSLAGCVPLWMVGNDDPRFLLDLIDRERISVVFCFPHTFLAMLEAGLDGWSLDSVRMWIAGADSSHEGHIRPFVERGAFIRLFGRPLMRSLYADTYGSSEVGFAALFRIASRRSKLFGRYLGKPTFAGPRIRVVDERGRTVPNGTVGELAVKGPTLFKGYWNAHDRHHGVIRDGWWFTGDVGYRDARGRFFHFDRKVDVIRTAEGAVYTLPVEEELLKRDDVQEAVVIGVPDGSGHELALALVQPRAGCRIDPARLLSWARGRPGGAARLAAVETVGADRIPRGLTGKVLKRELRRTYADYFTARRTERRASLAG